MAVLGEKVAKMGVFSMKWQRRRRFFSFEKVEEGLHLLKISGVGSGRGLGEGVPGSG